MILTIYTCSITLWGLITFQPDYTCKSRQAGVFASREKCEDAGRFVTEGEIAGFTCEEKK
jgi:hypothetical protein